jgi:hypothetical protein
MRWCSGLGEKKKLGHAWESERTGLGKKKTRPGQESDGWASLEASRTGCFCWVVGPK